jgi:cysteinyl-tRNA synthetase
VKLYNTPKQKLEDFRPLDKYEVKIYTCGPTVYDYPHIGNWFTFIRYDLLVRLLQATAYNPKWVINITDVGHLVSDADEGEDKLEKGAAREGKTAQETADYYTDYFLEGMKRLNFLTPAEIPRATDNIAEQISLIQKLDALGYAYRIDDGIYFDVSRFPAYTDFAHLNLQEQRASGRVHENSQKRTPADFALWKFSPQDKQRDMEWDSPWGKGFPGWHIECSAMILKFLGVTIDIHGGGIDHISVHHTNEVAQSEAANRKPLANYWFHSNHVLLNDRKLAKSEGNGITLEDVEKRGYSLEALRLLVISSHYRTQSTFSWETLTAAANRLRSLRAFADLRWQPVTGGGKPITIQDLNALYPLLENDLDTPAALAAVAEVADRSMNELFSKDSVSKLVDYLKLLDELFGLRLSESADISEAQRQLIDRREKARAEENWTEADRLREELKKQGLEINDTTHGPIWSRL